MNTQAQTARFAKQREVMVERQIAERGIQDAAVQEAMRTVPREAFVSEDLAEFAYRDAPLPIGEGQTISQPYIVARMAEVLELTGGERVLDIGAGSGYAAAVMSRIAGEVYAVERHASLAEKAEERLRKLHYDNVHLRRGDGTLGWSEHAPFDAISAAAAGPEVPNPLLKQLAIGGRLVMPTGPAGRPQRLVRVRRTGEDTYEREELGHVQFVPLVGRAGFEPGVESSGVESSGVEPLGGDGAATADESATVPERIGRASESVSSIEAADLGGLLDRIGDARAVLLGEATHGTAEFYDMRAAITRALIERKGFKVVAVEADWPDAAWIDRYVRGGATAPAGAPASEKPFTRFPTWMWANTQVLAFVEWLRGHNRGRSPEEQVGFYGLDLYSLHTSIGAVLGYLEDVDPEAARVARERYGCLSPWEQDPATYGRVALSGGYRECEEEVVAMLQDLLEKRLAYAVRDGQRFFDATQNARLVADAERYYRTMYYGSVQSWNLRDRHMFETLEDVLDFHGPEAKAVVWAHNSHLGDASATEMGARGEHNVGQLCREAFGDGAYLIGFGTDRGTVAAASRWEGPMEVKEVRPAHERSYERLMREAGPEAFLLPLRTAPAPLREELQEERLERAIGVVYRPETELQSHYFRAVLPQQFDEYAWFGETHAVTPLEPEALESEAEGRAETFPFGV